MRTVPRHVFAVLMLVIFAATAAAQSRDVDPEDLQLRVRLERPGATPYEQELVLLTVEGIYRRHITLEHLVQPALDGFDWMQLGEDFWFDSRPDGRKVKNFRRRMALFAQRPGHFIIPPFVHELQLTDENDDWFSHQIGSAPIEIDILPRPAGTDWWLPVSRLEISDSWSNAPDQLGAGEGVLRIVRIEATGVAPEAIPPMPELRSPSGRIFAHPEKRLVELSPDGPVSVAFWRWTVQPGASGTAILEPFGFDYYDTRERTPRHVTVSAQRVARSILPPAPPPQVPARLSAMPVALASLTGFAAALLMLWQGRSRRAGALRRRAALSRAALALVAAGLRGDGAALRRASRRYALAAGGGRIEPGHGVLLHALDNSIFAPGASALCPLGFVRDMLFLPSAKPGSTDDRIA